MNLKYLLRIVGSVALGALAVILFVLPGIHALTPTIPVVNTSLGLVAFAGNDPTMALNSTTTMPDVDPEATGPERVYFEVEFGNSRVGSGPLPDPVYNTVDAHPEDILLPTGTAQTDSLRGTTVLLLGPLATGLQKCDDPLVTIKRKLGYASLTDVEKIAVVNYLTGQLSTQTGQNPSQGTNPGQYKTPGDVAYGLTYTTLQARYFFGSSDANLSMTATSGEVRSYNRYFNYFTCSFSRSSFWSTSNAGLSFHFPAETVNSSGTGNDTIVGIHRTIQDVGGVNSQLLSTEGSSQQLDGGINQIDDRKVVSDQPSAQASVPQVSAQFSDASASQSREALIFVGGAALSIVAGLLVSVLKTIVVWAGPPVRRRMAGRASRDASG